MKNTYKFSTFFWRIYASHLITYAVMGIIASNLLNYEEIFNSSETFRPYDSPWIPAGLLLQVFRALVMAVVLWFFKENFLQSRLGWIKLWGLLVGLTVFSTAAAPAGSIEGFIYTTLSIKDHISGYFELIPQIGLFSFLLCYWYKNPKKLWNILAIIFVALILLMGTLGVLAAAGILQVDA